MRTREDSHRLLSHFFHALSHRLRTPLSIVSNNLSTINSGVDPIVTQSRQKIEEIVLLLGEINGLCQQIKFEAIDLAIFADKFRDSRISNFSSSIEPGEIFSCDTTILLAALSELYLLLDSYGGKRSEIFLNMTNSSQAVHFQFRAKALSFGWLDGKAPQGGSLSDLFNGMLDYDTPFAAVIDGVLEAHDAKIEAAEGSIDISIPLQRKE